MPSRASSGDDVELSVAAGMGECGDGSVGEELRSGSVSEGLFESGLEEATVDFRRVGVMGSMMRVGMGMKGWTGCGAKIARGARRGVAASSFGSDMETEGSLMAP